MKVLMSFDTNYLLVFFAYLISAVAGFESGKQLHMASAADAISAEYHIKVTRNNTLLVDDDLNNVRVALKGEVRALWFDVNTPDKFIQDLKELLAADDVVSGISSCDNNNNSVSCGSGACGNLLSSPSLMNL